MARIKPPRPFNFHAAADWPAWMYEFDDYRFAPGLHEKPDVVQVRTLLYTMSRKSREIPRSLNVKEEEMEDFDLVKSKYKGYFAHTKNTAYENARFNLRRQQLGETVDQFATELNRLADRCEFNEMKARLIRNRSLVGLQDHLLLEELQMDPNLTLSTALAKARTSETAKKQQAELKEHEGIIPEACVGVVKPEKTPGKSKTFTRGHKPAYCGKFCSFCAGPFHPRSSCPAQQERCRFCRKLDHFEKACRKKKQAGGNLDNIAEPDKFLGTVDQPANRPFQHFVTVLLNDHKLRIKVDTGAEVTVVGKNFPSLPRSLVKVGDLKERNNSSIRTIGKFDAEVAWKDNRSKQTIYVVHNLRTPLLGLPAIKAIGVVRFLDDLGTANDFVSRYPKFFQGTGSISGEHTIRLVPNATPYTLATPRPSSTKAATGVGGTQQEEAFEKIKTTLSSNRCLARHSPMY
ncbi:uncharacterized protein LOC142557413 [Dermacentor variabilis]|uniref:uncharacterized protein LOC142557413 n=1 Tax=Dermacentor variabilis TaxID=34621 RepID=UPI003F5AF06B